MVTRKKLNDLVMLASVAMLAGLANCAKIPAPDLVMDSGVEKAAYPTLLPEDALPTNTTSESNSAAIAGNLDARATALRTRAAALLLLTP
ncbi:MAG: hypothetical protein WBO29_04280 [Albidovulum sp.]